MKITPLNITDNQSLVCLNHMRFAEYGKVPVVLFEELLDIYRKANDTTDGEQRVMNQGVCQFLRQFIENIGQAGKTSERVNTPPLAGSTEF